MNKRIRALAEQSGKHYRTTKPGAYMWPTPCVDAAVPKEFLEKFAELIIKECAHIAWLNSTEDNVSHTKIKQHFGIKE